MSNVRKNSYLHNTSYQSYKNHHIYLKWRHTYATRQRCRNNTSHTYFTRYINTTCQNLHRTSCIHVSYLHTMSAPHNYVDNMS